MKYYIQYLDSELQEPCGDRSIVILDGRNKLGTMIEDAKAFNGYHRPQYPHFRIMQGDFRKAFSIYTTVKNEKLGFYSGY